MSLEDGQRDRERHRRGEGGKKGRGRERERESGRQTKSIESPRRGREAGERQK